MAAQDYASETLLQELLAKYPNLLAGNQINSDVPRRWLLVSHYLHARTGIVIPELKHGMLEKRSTAQPTLFDQKGGV
ncbi:MAG TPA: hypothetical protein VEY13_01050, partial [Rubrobacteraceae bacterium]|nr:hypothetical protein [Rubrobacteraceae bacterium]